MNFQSVRLMVTHVNHSHSTEDLLSHSTEDLISQPTELDTHDENYYNHQNSLCLLVSQFMEAILSFIIDMSHKSLVYMGCHETFLIDTNKITKMILDFRNHTTNFMISQSQFLEPVLFLGLPIFVSLLSLQRIYSIQGKNDDSAIKKQIYHSTKEIASIACLLQISCSIIIIQLLQMLHGLNLQIIQLNYNIGPLIPIGIFASLLNFISIRAIFNNES